ncbi:MAG: M56 family metallopeptidase [Pirellulales bacterium]
MISESFAWLLWTQTWQVAVVIGFVAVAHRVLARQRPHLAQTLWLLVLVKCLAPPIWSSPSGIFCWVQAELPTSESVDRFSSRPVTAVFNSSLSDLTAAELFRDSGNERKLSRPSAAISPTSHSPWSRAWEGLAALSFALPTWGRWIVASWVVGVLFTAGTLVGRWLLFACRLRQSDSSLTHRQASELSPAMLTVGSQLQRLAARLRIRRKVRVRVVEASIGPAVVGLFRPTVLLPGVLVRELSPEELEPILAHELVHIRRYDLWLCLAQSLTQSLWWFHPLVWWANQRLSEEIERCCDEEVVASLSYEPARYARSLLEVLERKRALRAAPAIPGVRPLQVTANRLERIMRLGQGSHRRTPRWCWISLLLAAVFLVPGGAFVAEGREKKRTRRSGPTMQFVPGKDASTRDLPQTLPLPSAVQTQATSPSGSSVAESPKSVRTYSLAAAISTISKLHSVSPAVAQAELLHHFKQMYPASAFALDHERLVARLNEETHGGVAEELTRVAEHGLRQVRILTRIMTFPANAPLPVMTSATILDAKSTAELITSLQGNPRANILQTPRILAWSGQVATVTDQTQRPFVIGYQNSKNAKVNADMVKAQWQPQVQVVDEGIALKFRPKVLDAHQVQLGIELQFQHIQRVDSHMVIPAPGEAPRAIQMPVVDSKHLQTAVVLQPGKSAIVGGLQSKTMRGESTQIAILVECEVIEPAFESNQAGRVTKVYQVADLVVPIPHSTRLSFSPNPVSKAGYWQAVHDGAEESLATPPRPAPQFAPLIELIQSTIQPDSWSGASATSRIEANASNLAVVVSASEEVHEQIADLFAQLRKLQGTQVSLAMRVFRTKGAEFLQEIVDDTRSPVASLSSQRLLTYVLKPAQIEKLLAGRTPVQLPKVTQFNGRSLATEILYDESAATPNPWLMLVPIASGDHRHVQLRLATGLEDPAELLSTATERTLATGDSLLVDVTRKVLLTQASRKDAAFPTVPLTEEFVPGVAEMIRERKAQLGEERYWMLITPTIIVQPDGEM